MKLSSYKAKPDQPGLFTTFSREITVAVVLKFLLLVGLWWLFFKGHKQAVDGDMIAAKLFGENPTAMQVQQSSEKP